MASLTVARHFLFHCVEGLPVRTGSWLFCFLSPSCWCQAQSREECEWIWKGGTTHAVFASNQEGALGGNAHTQSIGLYKHKETVMPQTGGGGFIQ